MHATSLQTNLLLESGIFLVFTNHLHIRIDFADGKAEHHHNNAENHGDNARNDDKCSRRFKRIDKKQNAEQKAQDGAENEKPLLIMMSLALRITRSMKVPMMTDHNPMAKMMSFMVAVDQKKPLLLMLSALSIRKEAFPKAMCYVCDAWLLINIRHRLRL